ncbi:MAG: acyltransferase family protein [Sphingomonas sp.]|uniref:acyltransferase family protein n=1 Tax=Sphingomonas sp. TaxID=28214 RepID=UPI0025FE2891|nr:acyltransferase family protein [Sphingomonas sp.]MBQ1500825.1 acyltransferase family protein [Sphingomonas sp.]
MERHYGMDWLRIGAFAILILYHVGMVFVPWGYHVKTAAPADWVAIPMLLPNAWRLMLLFLVSGFASRMLLAKSPGVGRFLANRNARLLLPLAFGMAVVVPPQSWVELVGQHGYAHDYPWFWARDYFRFGRLDGILLPTWNHLWFVAYLWIYTLALGALLTLRLDLQKGFDRLFGGAGALWVPLAWLLIFQVLLFRRGEETHDLIGDGIAHLAYFPAFLFGFGLAGSRVTMAAFARLWLPCAGLALASYAVVAGVEAAYPGFAMPGRAIAELFRVAREVQTWASIAALIGLAERFLNHDHKWRAMLTEAVFPFYIIHQTAIVLGEHWLLPLHLHPAAEFAILVAGTWGACWAFYLAGREIDWLRPLIGLRPRLAKPARSAREAASASGVA